MRNWKITTVGVLALASTLAGCEDYLSGPGLTDNPNQPSSASLDQLLVSTQVQTFVLFEGDLARIPAMWMQQMAGTDRQYLDYDRYDMTENDLSSAFSNLYTGGGLVDLRQIQQRADERGDGVYQGIAQVMEGFIIGMAASFWGAIPYSEAVSDVDQPALDPQAEVYRQVQTVLDQAIANLRAGGTGPRGADLIYGGDAGKWIEAAHTLKARFYMHWVEAQAAGMAEAQTACGGNCLQQAIAAAQNGISTPANNLVFPHNNKTGEQNIWYQFTQVERPGYISAGQTLVELLKERSDPRLTEYFEPTSSGQVVGAAPGVGGNASGLSATRGAAAFDQPMVTYAENQLILAEAHFRLGNEGQAITSLNNARAVAGLSAVSGVSGDALFREIALEKYIALFQNPEVWNDWKRTCIPALAPAAGADQIPARFLYGVGERNVNKNVPAPAAQPVRNTNDPNACS